MPSSNQNPASGIWTYRNLLNSADLSKDFNSFEFGRANLKIDVDQNGAISGKIYDIGWELDLKGSFQYGSPATLWFQGTGNVGGSPWAYGYLCYLVPQIPNGISQIAAMVGSVTRAISHSEGQGGHRPSGSSLHFLRGAPVSRCMEATHEKADRTACPVCAKMTCHPL